MPLPFTPRRLSLLFGLALAGTMALAAEEASDPAVRARIALMKDLKASSAALADMAAGKVPFDAAQAEAMIEALRSSADKVEPAFKPRADDPASDALPDIWTVPAEFRQKVNRLVKATLALEGSRAGDLADSLSAVAAACKDCHGRFKM